MMTFVTRLTAFAALAAIVTGCTATPVTTGAEKVIVSRTPAPKSCKFLGTITGEQGGSISGPWTSNKNLAAGAVNDMKNKSFELGANYVVLETNQAAQTDVTNTGNAYKCPMANLGL